MAGGLPSDGEEARRATVKEIQVIGGGPAGLGLGIALRRRGIPVMIREAGTFPRHRVCGEVLHALSVETILECDLTGLLEEAYPLRSTAWFSCGREVLRGAFPREGWGLSRYRMDAALAERFGRLGGAIQTGQRIPGGGVDPEGVAWCAGRRADPDSNWLGLKAHFRGVELRADVEMHLGRGGYVGLNRIEKGWVNVCGLFRRRAGIRAARENRLGDYLTLGGWEELAERLERGEMREGSAAGVSAFRLGPVRPADGGQSGILRLGDSRSMIGPFTGSGMAMAFDSAARCAPRLADYSEGRLSWTETVRACNRSLSRRFRIREAAAGLAHPLLASKGGGGRLPRLGVLGRLGFRVLYEILFYPGGGGRHDDHVLVRS
ncbi:MAG TPA: hypothetical protein VMN36_06755 [Verrucomicrobiales bacterium]|nr:hypothetical protein [Verrucomicrobiales bacterium]